MNKEITVADIFCGSGLFSSGFKEEGFKIVFGIDMNKNCCKTFQYNYPDAKVINDNVLSFSDYPKVDVVIGSTPCIEFSKGNVDRNFDLSLVKRFIEIVKQINPKYYVMENVPDVVTEEFKEKYSYFFPNQQILRASYFGAATTRTRFFGGKFPKVENTSKKELSVQEVIDINRSGYKQPYKERVYRRIDVSRPFGVICSQRITNQRYLLPNKTSLSVLEMAKLHGVPNWYVFPHSASEMERQIGLSVSPPVAKAIAHNIKKELEK
jgi:site-specific DNA-cytosine methylase